jgi:two-component system sensor histidine kinase UhpB
MWKSLSFRMRLLLPLGAMFAAAVLIGIVALLVFAPGQLQEESEPAQRSAKGVALALDGALAASENPEQTLDAFVQSLGNSEAIRFRRTGAEVASTSQPEVRTPLGRVPDWFVNLITMPDVSVTFPVKIKGKKVGEIIFAPDISAELFEKWIGFLALISISVVLLLLTGGLAHLITRSAVTSLQELGAGLTRMRTGHFEPPISPSGPPELRKSAEEANELARTLARLNEDNRRLLRKIVSLQDDERQDIARELHDELGPLLFGIRASTVVLMESLTPDMAGPKASAQDILQSVEALQYANRRILDRLRPLYIQELGLERSIHTLLQNARSQAPELKLSARIDPGLTEIDGLLSQTVYRVIQEAVTNVLRHANARSLDVTATQQERELTVEISDDGIGLAAGQAFGRGLTGMQERVRALSGTFELLRKDGWTLVRCQLPAITSDVSAPPQT